ncbi:MAG: VWA domain-containing protein [Eubacteriales bacterium]
MMKKVLKVAMCFAMLSTIVGCSSSMSSTESATAENTSTTTVAGSTSGYSGTDYDREVEEELMVEDFSTEEYNTFRENSILAVQDQPLSTFSIDVDTASYANVRRMILDGYLPDVDAVRTEEFLNYFSYTYDKAEQEEPIGIYTELTDCPWNEHAKLLAIGISTEELDTTQIPPSNLVFLIDTSGSMNEAYKLPLVQESFSLLVDQLKEEDRISIITYAGSNEVLLEGATYSDKQEILDVIFALTASGGTNGADAIVTAYDLAERYFIEGGNNRIILATDGDLNIGMTSESALKELVEEKREGGVFLSALGFGSGNYKDNKMETLSQNGNGNYYYIDSKIEARKVLVEEMGSTLLTVAKDVKIQVEFNPSYIQGYRLIGFENRMLQSQDFTDDTKDAGEIGAGHEVIALYEIITVDSDQGVEGVDLKYQEQVSVESSEMLNVSVRYKNPDEDESKQIDLAVVEDDYTATMSDHMKLWASIAEFTMLLRDSEYKGISNYEAVLERIKETSYFIEDDYVVELYTLVKKASDL